MVDIVECNNLILTTGAWINQLLSKLGINTGIMAKKRQLFRISGLSNFVNNTSMKTKINSIPFIILPSGGVFIKPVPENGSVDVGCSDDIGRKFELNEKRLDNPQGELEFYITNISPVLESYFPKIFHDKVKIDHPSAGMYAYSLDKNPVIDSTLGNLFFSSGASGSGIMKGDAIARITVAKILGEKQTSLFGGENILVSDFSIKKRNLPQENLVL